MVTLISFDVDGTLIRSIGEDANALHKEAFTHSMNTTFDVNANIDVVKHHGSTDPLILIKVLELYGVPKEKSMAKVGDFNETMCEYFSQHSGRAGQGLEVLPGVKQLLEYLNRRDDVHTCLVTGNMEGIGWAKMEALGLADLFTSPRFGGFGSDFCSGNTAESWQDRGELVKIANQKGRENLGVSYTRHIHVGDTPMDVKAAQLGGAEALGVLTGIFTREELLGAHPEAVILEDLGDFEAVLKVLDLWQ